MAYQSDLAGLGQFIRERRKELSLTQTELGSRLGWAQERVSALEHGKYGLPSLPQFCRLADALGISLEMLLHHAGVDAGDASSPMRDRSSEHTEIRGLSRQMGTMLDRMQTVEGHLHRAEHEMERAEVLRASIRAQRERMASLLDALHKV